MSAPVETSIDIAADPQQVWDLVMDPERLKDWVSIHRGLGRHSDGPARVGSWMEQSMALRGAPFKVQWELVECEPPHSAEWHGKGPARSRAETAYRLEAIEGGTRFQYRNEFKAPLGPLGSVASKLLVGGLPEKEARTSLNRLKSLLEKLSESISGILPVMPDFLSEKVREIDARMKELRPLVEEYHRLEAAASALSGVSGSAQPVRKQRRAAAPKRKAAASGTGRRGRPKGSGQRSKQALEIVRAKPGITIPDLAEAMGIKQNYLYRVMPELQKDGMVRKEGRGWHAKDAA